MRIHINSRKLEEERVEIKYPTFEEMSQKQYSSNE